MSLNLNFTFTNTTIFDIFDNFDINSRYHLSQTLEKLLIYSTLFNEYMFNITDIGYRYYIENTFFVNMLLLSVFFVYRMYYVFLKSIENSNFAIKNICNELFENVEKLIIKNIELTKEKENIYKLLLLEKESNMQYDYINKNLSDIQSDIMKIKDIINDTEIRAVKKIPLVSYVINRLTKNLKNHKILINKDDQIILLSDDVEL